MDAVSGELPPGQPESANTTARRSAVRRTRIGGWWVALVAGTVVLLLLLIFVLQNGQPVQITFLGWRGVLPLGVALLLAAIGGILAVAIPGTGRILQLRHAARPQQSTRASAGVDEPSRPSVQGDPHETEQ
jgi:putative membrane protein